MSANTIKVIGNTGEVYISPQTTQTYKNITLFGYGYLDWGRIINQSLVTLIDNIETLSTGGADQVIFNLENYTEEQKVARTQEFELWKTEYKSLLDTTINEFTTTINDNILEFTNAQNIINNSIEEELASIDGKITEEYNNFISVVDQKILDIVNTNLANISDTINNAISATNSAISNLNNTKLSLDQKVLEFNNLISNFKETFSISFDSFKSDTEKTLEDNKNIIIQYINEKLLGYSTIFGSQSDRLDALELSLEGVNLDSLQSIIVTKVNDITTNVVNSYLTGLVTRITTMETYFENISSTITNKIDELLSPVIETINTDMEILTNKFITYDSTLSDFNNMLVEVNTWTRDFDNMINIYYKDTSEFLDEINYIKEDFTISAGRNTSLVTIMKKIVESNINQTDYNNKNTIGLIEQTRNGFISALRNSNFDENSLIKNETYRTNLLTNGLINYKFDTIFKSGEFELLEFGYSVTTDTSKIKFLFLSMKIPDTALPNDFDMAKLRISLGGLTVPETSGFNFFQCPIFRLPRQYLIIDDLTNYIINYEKLISDNNIGTVNDTIYYADTQSTDIIIVNIPEEMAFTSDMLITLTLGTDNINFKIDELENKTSGNFVSEVVENISSYSVATQALINNTILPHVVYSETQNDINIPVKEIVKTTDGKEFHIKVNLPDTGSLTNIVYNDGITGDVTKTITNRNTFDFDLASYNSNGWDTTDNFYKDISTTGILKFPVDPTTKKVTGTINYKIGTTSYSEEFSSEVSGGLDLGNYNMVNNLPLDELNITYNDVTKFNFSNNGDFTAEGNIFAYSDKKLKENLESIPKDIYYKIMDIQTYQYNFIGKDQKQFGFIAQEIEKYFPELVTKDENGIYKVNYIGFIPIISEFLKYLDSKTSNLETRMNEIESILNNR